MKSLGKIFFYHGLQVHHLLSGSILLHQQAYILKILKAFQMDQANLLSTPMIGRSKTNEDHDHPCEEEEIVDKSKYLTAVGVLPILLPIPNHI